MVAHKKVILSLLMSLSSISIYARESDVMPEGIHQLNIGNLALPGSQQPGSLFGFGQNIVDKGGLQLFALNDTLFGCHKQRAQISTIALYGITDDISFLVTLPIIPNFKQNEHHSSGISDIVAQMEYALYTKKKEDSTLQITLVTALYLPSGNSEKNPPTGAGSTSFFLGITAGYLSPAFIGYGTLGTVLTTSRGIDTKSGNQFLYQTGFGANIAYDSEKWLLAAMIELVGTYIQKDRINDIADPNSGSNTILLGPSLWFSTQKLALQFGVAPVIYQHAFGKQSLKDSMQISCILGWKFN